MPKGSRGGEKRTGEKAKTNKKIETISKNEWDKMPKDYKGTLKELVNSRVAQGEKYEDVVKQYTQQGYDVNKDKTMLKGTAQGTILTPVKVIKENTITINNRNFGETYTIDKAKRTFTVKTSKGSKTFSFDRMDEIVRQGKNINRMNKPMSVLAYTDYKNGKINKWL